jgi:orotate phosphoribosyltransferase
MKGTAVIEPSHSRRIAAGLLLDAGCVSLLRDEPFRLPSGWASPAYMDCRRLISFPAIRRALVTMGVDQLRASGALDGTRGVAGGESSGIALAAWIADALNLPLQYVRKKPQGTGQVEGVIEPGDRLLLVDDLLAAGQSKVTFSRALRQAGAVVRDTFVVFDYGTFGADRMLGSMALQVHALTSWHDVHLVASERPGADPRALAELQAFLDDPSRWSMAHGGIGGPALAPGGLEERQQ